LADGVVEQVEGLVTAGAYPLVVTGSGRTVQEAAERAYETAWGITWPSNVMFRTDIGKRLERDLVALQRYGYAAGLVY
jgi:phosphoribosylamine-glycine ligase